MSAVNSVPEAYIELLKRSLTNELYKDHEYKLLKRNNILRRAFHGILGACGIRATSTTLVSDPERETGLVIAPVALTLIGHKRLDNIHRCLKTVVEDKVPGDVIETGVWRGGAVIFMRGVLNAYGAGDRKVWVADSFAGLPPPDPKHQADAGAHWHTRDELAISLESVQESFRRFGLLEGVEFLKGWFKDTLPGAPLSKLALARLDGDMYGSTMDALTALYDRLSPGGFLIVDDYNGVKACKAAVDDFRAQKGIKDPVETVDWTAVWWRKTV
ncbi:MAG: class I SAM-dependent methyltransferase [Planctomycetes bacterium]|nr:class I SAM-dependent methyltransferase [Planctomycetota bacterium]